MKPKIKPCPYAHSNGPRNKRGQCVNCFYPLTTSPDAMDKALDTIAKRDKRIKELEAMCEGRTISCVCWKGEK